MPITRESIENFQKGILGDRFFGVGNAANGDIHLAIGGRKDRAAIPEMRRSTIGGVQREVIPGAGGHTQLAEWAGVEAQQLGPGVATGAAYGFMIEITSTGLSVALRSGLNWQHVGPRPSGTRSDDEERTLPDTLAQSVKRELDMLGLTITVNLGDV